MKLIDAESTLISKAIDAPQKNKQLIRQAIASGKFPDLVDRIIENNGKLDILKNLKDQTGQSETAILENLIATKRAGNG